MTLAINKFKSALLAGQQQYGLWLGLCNPLSAELCAQCGYDWLLIDAEHAPNDLRSIHSQLMAINGSNSHPIVRMVEGSTAGIKQLLDLGAQTLLVPMVETAQQAQALVAAMHYPPSGVRGVGTALARAAKWNHTTDYLQQADAQVCLLVQAESVRAVENLHDILQVDGVDGVFIGPADLAASMGYLGQPSHPEVVKTIELALGKIRQAGKAAGILATSSELARKYEACGAQFVALGVDTLLLGSQAKQILQLHIQSDSEMPQGNGAY